MNDQDKIEQEMQEASTETPAFLGCPQHMPTKLPSGFDGVEPGEKSKIEASIKRMREKLSKIADIALAADAKCVNIEKLGVRYLECSKALCEIRMMCGRDLAEKAGIAAGTYYSPSWLGDLAKELGEKRQSEIQRVECRLFKTKHNTRCHGTYIYDRICINDAHIRATLHPDNGGLEQHAMIWIGDSQRCFCYCTFNTTSAVKCDYVVRGMLAGIAKRLVYHHKNLIKLKAKWAAAKAAKKGGAK